MGLIRQCCVKDRVQCGHPHAWTSEESQVVLPLESTSAPRRHRWWCTLPSGWWRL